jgi:hypothetical protein
MKSLAKNLSTAAVSRDSSSSFISYRVAAVLTTLYVVIKSDATFAR